MKYLFVFLAFISISALSQDFKNVDAVVHQYPRFSDPETLAAKINQDFSSDQDKSRAVFMWLATNIRYDLEAYYNPTKTSFSFQYSSEAEKQEKIQAIRNQIVQKTFATKQGVCENYAQSFKKVGDLVGLETAIIKGSVRNSATEIGNVSQTANHAWNAIKLNGKWLYLDATWAAGSEMNGKWQRNYNDYFYDMPLEKIFQTHYPEEKIWELRIGRISRLAFYNQPIYGNALLSMDVQLVSPKRGIVHLSNKENILIKFKNLPQETTLFYVFKNDQYAQKPRIKQEQDNTLFTIPSPSKNTELYLFINNELALQYKVILN